MDRSEMSSDNLARVYPAVLKAPHLAGPINGVGARGVISKRSQIEKEGSLVSGLNLSRSQVLNVSRVKTHFIIHNFYLIR
jgi:hypothetical protein